MSSTDTSGKPYTFVGTPVHQNQWDEGLQAVVPGWKVTARWNGNGSVIHVFVPDTAELSSTADALIRFQGAQLDALTAIGR